MNHGVINLSALIATLMESFGIPFPSTDQTLFWFAYYLKMSFCTAISEHFVVTKRANLNQRDKEILLFH